MVTKKALAGGTGAVGIVLFGVAVLFAFAGGISQSSTTLTTTITTTTVVSHADPVAEGIDYPLAGAIALSALIIIVLAIVIAAIKVEDA